MWKKAGVHLVVSAVVMVAVWQLLKVLTLSVHFRDFLFSLALISCVSWVLYPLARGEES